MLDPLDDEEFYVEEEPLIVRILFVTLFITSVIYLVVGKS